jgi:nucleoside-diphosphate-sugar epimerase
MIFIIGGKGFVGQAFVAHCERAGLDHVCLTRNNYAAYVGQSCDVLINANGNSKKYLAAERPTEDFALSVESVNRTLADFTAGVYAYLSTIDVYPSCQTPAQTLETTAIDPAVLSNYGLHKWMAEWLVRRHAPRWVIFRLGGMVGPGMKKSPVYDLLHGVPLRVAPESRFQYVDTATVARVVLELSGHTGEIFNVCGNGTVSPAEMAAAFDLPLTGDGPQQVYEASNAKVSRHVTLPASREVVLSYLAETLGRSPRPE